MENRDKVIIVRITEKEEKAIKELRDKFSINISNLVRSFLNEYYKKMNKES